MKNPHGMSLKYRAAALGILLCALFAASPGNAQATFGSEDFTTGTTLNSWYFFGGACLTAGTASPAANPGQIPGCTSVLGSYYHLAANADPFMMGGDSGYLGSSTAPASVSAQIADPIVTNPDGSKAGHGALRFTNGSINVGSTHSYGHNERGAILSSSTYPTGAGFQVTFKTITYHGDSGGAGTDGADGISFFLQDGSQTAGLGAWGGSLAYSCSNGNTPYDGLAGAYLGLGIDEYGNFLNGSYLMPGYTGTNSASGDNSAYGYGYKPGRIGLRGAGNIAWPSLTAAYGNNPSNSAAPYYPASLATSCNLSGGTYSAASGNCINICSTAGSFYDSATGQCNKACPTGATYDAALNTCNSCTSVNGTYNAGTTMCTSTNVCASGTTYYAGTGVCNACPATGYSAGSFSTSTGMCINSCPTGYTRTGSSCYPNGSVTSSGFYCPSGNAIANNAGSYVCYTSGLSYLGGYYCPTGQTIVLSAGAYGCYPSTGAVYNSTYPGYYCPSGNTVTSNSGADVCYPSSGVNYAAGYYCASGSTVNGAYCYPTGDSKNTTTNVYCASGNTLNSAGTNCYPTSASAQAGNYYCTGSSQTINGAYCYPNTVSSFSMTTDKYCASGNTLNSAGTNCYPTSASAQAGNYYCTGSGQTINGAYCYPSTASSFSLTTHKYCASGTINSAGTNCYPTSASAEAGNYYCTGAGQAISGANCYPSGDAISGTSYCPAGDIVSSSHCCPSGTTYTGPHCSNGSTPGALTAMPAATAMPTATAMTGATAMPTATAMTGATTMPAASAMTGATAMPAASAMPNATAAPAATAVSPAAAAGAATAMAAVQSVTPIQTATINTTPTESPPSTYAPGTGIVDAEYAVQNTCATGNLYNYSSVSAPTSAGTATLDNPVNTAGVLDYAPIPNAYTELNGFQIANESAITRGAATPIFYNLKITQNGLLSFSYSVSGGAYSYLIKNQSITASNGPLPASFRVGFAGSDGGASNIHEIMCFKASTYKLSGSSATANEKESAKVQSGTQAYFAYYDPSDWTGTVTANALTSSGSVVTLSTTATWDAACLLSGTTGGAPTDPVPGGCGNTGASGPTSATPGPGARVMLTFDTVNHVGIPFEWTNLNAAQQAALDFGDPSATSTRLDYLRGDRSNEVNSAGAGLYRARDTIVGDIVDSSPMWVGPPSSPYTATWTDRLYGTGGSAMPENASGSQSYLQFTGVQQTRLNVVYVGANDGFLHGFRAGSFSSTGAFVNNGSTPNDGQEVLAYMPGATLASAALGSAGGGCSNSASTQTVVQGIHGVTPAIGASPECVMPLLDYANPQYAHNFFVDATPGSGDLFYGNAWHTWLVGGLGAGGQAVFALDITNPSNFAEANASGPTGIVVGEWNSASITCANALNCGQNLGNTFGTPQIRRLHNGNWAVIFGNGFGSSSGDAGIYIMSIDSSSGARTFYYLSTGTSGANGIAYVTPFDMDGDHITDYVYAGDLYGNLWRFDLTGKNPTSWGAQGSPLFTTQFQSSSLTTNTDVPSGNVLLFASVSGVAIGQAVGGTGIAPGTYVQSVVGSAVNLTQSVSGDVPSGTTITFSGNQPITSYVLPVSTTITGGAPRVMLEFGTGARAQLTNLAPVQYASGVQTMYGIWDWNLAGWNTLAPGAVHQSLAATTAVTGLASPYTLSYSNLAQQTLTVNSNGTVDGTNNVVCWQGSSTCTGTNNQFGWYENLPSSGEQIIYNPVFQSGAFQINSVVPANNIATSCSSNQDTGYTYQLAVINGGVFNKTFPTYTAPGTSTVITDAIEAGVETNATGSVYNVTSAGGTASYIVYQTISGSPSIQQINIPSNTKSKRLTWIEQR
jgi:type IV pilus assembly protein PilY1